MAEVRLIVDLFEDINFGGSRRTLVRDLNDFRLIEFNDRASSVIVTAGPNFQTGDTARLWSDVDFQGSSIVLPPGQFPDLRTLNFNDVASSLSISAGPIIIAEERQRETLRFNLQIITPPGTSLVSVLQNRILNPTGTGVFTGPTTVRVTGTFVDEIVVLIRDNVTGVTRQATGRATITFVKNINFPELAGENTAGLAIVVTFANISNTFTLAGNILSKTVVFDLITQVVRRFTTQTDIAEASLTSDEYTVEVE